MTTEHDHDHDGVPAPERRSFLGVISGLIVAGVSTVLGVTIGRYSISPAFSTSNEQDWTDLGSVNEFAEGKLVKKSVIVSQDAGWGKFQTQRSVWVVKNGESVKIFSGVCPHLGCSVGARADKCVCACHGTDRNVEGGTQAEPTPRRLDTLDSRVKENKLK